MDLRQLLRVHEPRAVVREPRRALRGSAGGALRARARPGLLRHTALAPRRPPLPRPTRRRDRARRPRHAWEHELRIGDRGAEFSLEMLSLPFAGGASGFALVLAPPADAASRAPRPTTTSAASSRRAERAYRPGNCRGGRRVLEWATSSWRILDARPPLVPLRLLSRFAIAAASASARRAPALRPESRPSGDLSGSAARLLVRQQDVRARPVGERRELPAGLPRRSAEELQQPEGLHRRRRGTHRLEHGADPAVRARRRGRRPEGQGLGQPSQHQRRDLHERRRHQVEPRPRSTASRPSRARRWCASTPA